MELPQVFPASPEASSYGKYGDIAVNMAIGQANHEIPIHNIVEQSFSLPVFLEYNYSGLVVEEIHGSTGLGWNLRAGGMITRQIKGLPDESQNGYFGPNKIGEKVYKMEKGLLSTEEEGLLKENAANGKWDTESDKYLINIAGISASFYLNHQGDPVFLPYSSLKLERLETGGFKLTDTSGVQYFFTIEETTQIENFEPDTIMIYPSAWLVAEIILPNNKKFNFSYLPYSIRQRTYVDTYTKLEPSSPTYEECVNTKNLEGVDTYITDSEVFGMLLSRISGNNQEINFNYNFKNGSNYGDGENPSSLKNITIQDSNQTVMSYTFEYDNLSSSRKLLKSIHKGKDSQNQEENFYQFEYYRGTLSEIPYYKQDHWGYYNGNLNTSGRLIAENSNRAPSFSNTVLGALKKIHYPTKGSSEFIYEQNEVSGKLNTGDVGVEDRLNTPIEIIINSDNYSDSEYIYETITVPFTPEALPDGQHSISLSYYLHGSAGYSLAFMELRKVNSTQNVTCSNSSICNYKTDFASAEQSPVTKNLDKTYYNLEPGNYELKVILERAANVSDPSKSPRAVANIFLEYFDSANNTESDSSVAMGGIRIKEVISCTGPNENCNRKKYNYLKEDGTTPSGINLSKPNYISHETHNYAPDTNPPGSIEMTCNLKRVTSTSSLPLSSFIGSPVLYKSVEEISIGQNGEEIKRRLHFSGEPDVEESFPYAQRDKKNWKKGLSLKTEFYKNSGTESLLIKEESNNYSVSKRNENSLKMLNSYNLKAGRLRFFYTADGSRITQNNGAGIYLTAYTNSSELYLKISSQMNNYYFDGTSASELTELKNFEYDYPYGQLSKQSFVDSKGGNFEELFKYPYDYTTDVYTSMVAENQISSIVNVSSKKGKLLHQKHTEYGDFGGKLFLPKEDLYLKSNDSTAHSLLYHHYDTSGNPIEISKKSGPHIVYLWGYDDRYPIAKIDNASYPEISSALGVTNLSEIDETDLLEINLLRDNSNLANTMITTYTYQPAVGVTSTTDPKGDTVTYHYDSFNRLEFVKDKDGNIISENKYNYKGSTN
ncbi:RHS repeat protein [Salegentibacter sp. JZCK2]|uniref:RHS repeat domain-containing protein n=1 Tax=Salegentibacter tibetensis TaxID=2873600 RepID=UPI001CCCB167|nr:RHS repeat domain-containing protein [Salegentibacter tibetensis]MBZ9731573.1 RHS repeat protein [Salegentibacter tibetensis]